MNWAYKKFTGPDGIHPQEVAGRCHFEATLGNLSLIMAKGKVPEDQGKTNATPIFRKVKKEDLGNCMLVSFTSVIRKVIEQLTWKPYPGT